MPIPSPHIHTPAQAPTPKSPPRTAGLLPLLGPVPGPLQLLQLGQHTLLTVALRILGALQSKGRGKQSARCRKISPAQPLAPDSIDHMRARLSVCTCVCARARACVCACKCSRMYSTVLRLRCHGGRVVCLSGGYGVVHRGKHCDGAEEATCRYA
jgi:hypothetical protein